MSDETFNFLERKQTIYRVNELKTRSKGENFCISKTVLLFKNWLCAIIVTLVEKCILYSVKS